MWSAWNPLFSVHGLHEDKSSLLNSRNISNLHAPCLPHAFMQGHKGQTSINLILLLFKAHPDNDFKSREKECCPNL